jgi:hypothetical protein
MRTATTSKPASVRCLRSIEAVLIACLVLALGGCATFAPPQPWEKGDLARASMRFDGDPLATRATQHIYQSKEAAGGGGTVGGGGCGCN